MVCSQCASRLAAARRRSTRPSEVADAAPERPACVWWLVSSRAMARIVRAARRAGGVPRHRRGVVRRGGARHRRTRADRRRRRRPHAGRSRWSVGEPGSYAYPGRLGSCSGASLPMACWRPRRSSLRQGGSVRNVATVPAAESRPSGLTRRDAALILRCGCWHRGIGAAATTPVLSSRWYRRLNKPPWQPPGPVFGPVWSVIYALIAASMLVARARGGEKQRPLFALFGTNLALNLAWTLSHLLPRPQPADRYAPCTTCSNNRYDSRRARRP